MLKERALYVFWYNIVFFIPWNPLKYLYILQLKNPQHHSVSRYHIAFPIPTIMYDFIPKGSEVGSFLPFLAWLLEQDYSAAARLLRSWVRIPPGAWIFVCCECRVLSGRGLCDELITRPEESYRLSCVVVCDLETSRMGVPYIYIYMTLVA